MTEIKKLTAKEYFDLRLKCLEMFVTIGSKTGIEQDVVFLKADKAFKFMIGETPEAKENAAPQSTTESNSKIASIS